MEDALDVKICLWVDGVGLGGELGLCCRSGGELANEAMEQKRPKA